MSNMILSPEFHRQLWMKITPVRLLLVPLLLAMGLSVFVIDNDKWAEEILWPAMTSFILIVMVWGCYDAAGALRDETKGNTWDFQRMSSIGPWQMGMGKLFGATSYVWVFGVVLLAVLAVAYSHMELTVQEYSRDSKGAQEFIFRPGFADVYYAVVIAALAGVIANMTSFLASVMNLRQRSAGHITPFLSGAFVGIFVLQAAMGESVAVPGNDYMARNMPDDIEWWGMMVDHRFMTLCLMLFAVYWLTAGIYRAMREELGFRNTPVVWGSFCLSMIVVMGGFLNWIYPVESLAQLSLCFLAVTYTVMLSEADGLAVYRRLRAAVRVKYYPRAVENTPKWLVSGAVTAVLFVAALLWPNGSLDVKGVVLTGGVTMLLLMARDGLVVHAFLLGRARSRNRFAMIVYYVVLYALLPMFLSSLFGLGDGAWNLFKGEVMEDANILIAFFPSVNAAALVAIPVLLIECGAALWFLQRRLRRLNAQ
jgi:hypothetical protein